ncbi:hypothetical protein FRB99_008486 [Tulasnella sp. 403]|nr:hypothetical protein FRB99_008486 [Tulasnella sp. 403]
MAGNRFSSLFVPPPPPPIMNLQGVTFQHQSTLPKLPIPSLEETCRRYLASLEALQDPTEHEKTQRAVAEFLQNDGPRLQEKLKAYAVDKPSYIEEFWYESYLSHSDPVVLALNPFFVLEDDPTPSRGSQLPRAARLIASSLAFVHDVRAGVLEPDTLRGEPLDMHQYTQLFGTARIPTNRGCRMAVNHDSRHIAILRRGQFYYFDVLDSKNRPVLTEREIMNNLEAIMADADKTPELEVYKSALGVLSTENRKNWSSLRDTISKNPNNDSCLQIVDDALFVVCLDSTSPSNIAEVCCNFLCGTYELHDGIQIGSCTNRWYDKLQLIVCPNGVAGINFEHTGVDGHTVLRFAAEIFTEGLMSMARSINPAAPTLFKAKLSPHAKSFRRKPGMKIDEPPETIDTSPKKLEWVFSAEIRTAIRFAETRLSDLICQNDCQVLEFKGYGKNFITRHGFSPDAFVQMAFQAGYYGLYGHIECTYEPAMTKAFCHGRTEAIRTVRPESVAFTKAFHSEQTAQQKIAALRKACEKHVKITKECSKGFGQDRHLYALYCLAQREIHGTESGDSSPMSPSSPTPGSPEPLSSPKAKAVNGAKKTNLRRQLPDIFTDTGYSLLGTSILSTSNCGNPALRLFGFAPVAADGFGIGYIIKDDAISIVATSKHLQTKRLLATIAIYLMEVQKMLVMLFKEANERQDSFIDHSGVLRDLRTGSVLVSPAEQEVEDVPDDDDVLTGGYSFFDSGDVEQFKAKRKRERRRVVTPFDVIKTRLQTQPIKPASSSSVGSSQNPNVKATAGNPVCCQPPTSNIPCVRQYSTLTIPSSSTSYVNRFEFRSNMNMWHSAAPRPQVVCLWDSEGIPRSERVTGFWDATLKVTRAEGVRGLWKGVGTTLVMAVPAQTIYMVTYDTLRKTFIDPSHHVVIMHSAPLVSGILARSLVSSLTSPLELLRTRLQSTPADPGVPHTLRSVVSGIRGMVARDGVRSLWKGLGPTLWRDVPFSGVYWAGFEALKKQFRKRGYTGWEGTFVSGAVSGTAAAFLTSPFDVLKTRRQALLNAISTAGTKEVVKTPTSTIPLVKEIIRTEGVRALYAGLTPRVAKIAPACGIMISCYEGVERYFHIQMD